MSQPPPPERSSSLEPSSPQLNRRPSSTKSSVKSGTRSVSKSIKNAFSRRKRSPALRITGMNSNSDYDLPSQRSGSIGPESFMSNHSIAEEEPRISEEAMLDGGEPTYFSPSFHTPLPAHVQAFFFRELMI